MEIGNSNYSVNYENGILTEYYKNEVKSRRRLEDDGRFQDSYNKDESDERYALKSEIPTIPTEWVGTQDEYDEIETKDENTTYYIIEE